MVDIVENILKERYYQPGETCWSDIAKRVSNFVGETKDEQRVYYELINNKRFIPNSPALMNAGTAHPMLFACFVLEVPDDMKGIGDTLTDAMCIQAKGGGTGFYFGNLRPKGSLVKSTNGIASGPVSFLKAYDAMTNVILQGGKRRGANMGNLNIDHKDIKEFVTCKSKEGDISNFNISVLMKDSFMRLPDNEVLDLIVDGMWRNGEPGIQFFENINRTNPTPELGLIYGSNPCLHEDTLMITKNGLERISAYDCVDLWNGSNFTSCRCWSNGIKNVIKVSTKSGFEWIVTPDHKFMLNSGDWCEAKDLMNKSIKFEVIEHDWIGVNPYPTCNYKVLGFEFGDGTYHKASNRMKYIYVTPEKDDEVAVLVEREFSDKFYVEASKRDVIKIPYGGVYASAFIGTLPERMIPDWILTLPKNEMRDFLCGLFSANGTNLHKYHKIQLVSSNKEMLQQVQQMLLLFGIKGKLWWHNKETIQTFYNGDYTCKQSWHLVLSSESYVKFLHEIGFIQTYKNGYTKEHSYQPEKAYEIVCDITDFGKVTVWDFNEPDLHYAVCSGANVHNCSETFLYPNESCVLGSIDVSKYYSGDEIDYERLGIAIEYGVRFLDRCIDVNEYPTQKIEITTKKTRKIGLGIMGFADLLIKMGIRYGSGECVDFIHTFMSWFDMRAVRASEELALQKGPLTINTIWKNPMRNALVTLIAPTGSIALFSGCSSGIEPNFSYITNRSTWVNGSKVTYKIVHPLFEKHLNNYYTKEHHDKIKDYVYEHGTLGKYSHDLLVTTKDITWKEHINVLSAFQAHVHNSISKTINCPHETTRQEVRDMIYYACESGCKGLTIYREGSRNDVVLETKASSKSSSNLPDIDRLPEFKGNPVEVEIYNPVEYKLLTATGGRILPKTPDTMLATVNKRYTACGKLYVIPAEAYDDLHSMFLINKGGCNAMTQALAELIGSMLRWKIPRWEIIRICSGISCNACAVAKRFKLKKISGNSCADIIAREILSLYPDDDEPSKEEQKITSSVDIRHGDIQMSSSELPTYNLAKCPECGESLIMESGCVTCKSCGFNKCS